MSTPIKYVLRKDNRFVSWDGKTMTELPSQAGRFSKTLCQRKYPGYEMLTFPDAYDQWHDEHFGKRGQE
jgi:hypothetical protein